MKLRINDQKTTIFLRKNKVRNDKKKQRKNDQKRRIHLKKKQRKKLQKSNEETIISYN